MTYFFDLVEMYWGSQQQQRELYEGYSGNKVVPFRVARLSLTASEDTASPLHLSSSEGQRSLSSAGAKLSIPLNTIESRALIGGIVGH